MVGGPDRTTGPPSPVTLGLVTLAVVGWGFGLARFFTGLGPMTHLSDAHPFGLWVAFDVACYVAMSAAGFTAAALVEILGRERYRGMLRPAILTAWLGYVFVGVGLLFDLGRYWNAWRPLVHWQGNSVLFEVAICVIAYLVVLTVEMSPPLLEGFVARAGVEGRGARFTARLLRPARALQRLVRLSLPAFVVAGVVLSCMHQSALGALLLIAPSKLSPLWWTPILPLLFLLSAIMAGLPMILIVSTLASRGLGREPDREALAGLARLIPWTLLAYGLLRLGDLLARHESLDVAANPGDLTALALELLVGLVVPGIMLACFPARRRSPGWLTTAGLLVVAGVVINRLNVFVVGFHPPASTGYFPSIGEIALTVGLLATLVLLFRHLVCHLPVLSPGEPPAPVVPDEPGRGRLLVRGLTAAVLLGCVFLAVVQPGWSPGGPAGVVPPEIPEAPPPAEHIPGRFPHEDHKGWTQGDCSACHHRHARAPEDRTGRELVALHRDVGIRLPQACATCHGTEVDDLSQTCARCHDRPGDPRAPLRPGLTAARHRNCLDCHGKKGRGPLDCVGCHAR